ncbi:TetR/AcrR family transcriptional regulator [Tsukamurella sp. 8F]|uniref:TetR/AcrR family transcriptional regulator n=1 Tax=unclassified Tsukamurella TaxID=2633480 RepID=UPI0023B9BA8D|nr:MULTISPECIES: TetR/AcrR family transcriptional regulator [unclassified Tsukamurella]MDF0530989.1 TetR/AcrR family transcriptional regulator [Tsukamurella sp. 8J]MDF0588690.1 TetR/AcrR family transcriptional regulator [Tsukamurella sp. 8F]
MKGTAERTRSTAEARRIEALEAALTAFSATGYHATTVSDVARTAGISHGYVMRLFATKLGLFVATLEEGYARITDALKTGAALAHGTQPEDVLASMADAYGSLIGADRRLLMVQVHAQSACSVPEIREAVRRGLADLTNVAHDLAGADAAELQRFFAYGQLCHLVATADLESVDEPWARTIDHGISH